MSATSARARIHPPRKMPEKIPNKIKKGFPEAKDPKNTNEISEKNSQKTHILIKQNMVCSMCDPCIAGNNGKADQKSCYTAGDDDSGTEPENTQKYLFAT